VGKVAHIAYIYTPVTCVTKSSEHLVTFTFHDVFYALFDSLLLFYDHQLC